MGILAAAGERVLCVLQTYFLLGSQVEIWDGTLCRARPLSARAWWEGGT